MTEWGVVGVLVVLIGLICTIIKPILNLNTSIVKLAASTDTLSKTIDKNEALNNEEHGEIWDRLDEDKTTINQHETRLSVVENQIGGK